MVNMIDHHKDPQTSLDIPRFCIMDGTANGVACFEGPFEIFEKKILTMKLQRDTRKRR